MRRAQAGGTTPDFQVDTVPGMSEAFGVLAERGGGCVNGDGREAVAKCSKCGALFCDSCLGYTVNDAPYCEPCANRLIDELRPRWLLVGAIVVGAFVIFVIGNGLYWVNFHYWNSAFIWLGVGLFLGAGRLAWHVANPLDVADKPRIIKRAPGDPTRLR